MDITTVIVAATAFTSIAAFNSPKLLNDWIFDPYRMIRNKEYYRFLTSGLLHGGWLHLIINMFVLYSFGRSVEHDYARELGSNATWFYMALYAGGLIVSDLPTFFKHKDNPGYRGLGASGAVSAILFASILFHPMQDLYIYGILPVPRIIAGALYLFYSAYAAKKSNDNINHDAHFYGAVFGFVFTLLLEPGLIMKFLSKLPFGF